MREYGTDNANGAIGAINEVVEDVDDDGAIREEECMALAVVNSEGYVAPPTKDVPGLASAAPRKIRRKLDLLFHPSAVFGGPCGPRLDCSNDVTGSETCKASSALKYDLCMRRIVEPVALACANTQNHLDRVAVLETRHMLRSCCFPSLRGCRRPS